MVCEVEWRGTSNTSLVYGSSTRQTRAEVEEEDRKRAVYEVRVREKANSEQRFMFVVLTGCRSDAVG